MKELFIEFRDGRCCGVEEGMGRGRAVRILRRCEVGMLDYLLL